MTLLAAQHSVLEVRTPTFPKYIWLYISYPTYSTFPKYIWLYISYPTYSIEVDKLRRTPAGSTVRRAEGLRVDAQNLTGQTYGQTDRRTDIKTVPPFTPKPVLGFTTLGQTDRQTINPCWAGM